MNGWRDEVIGNICDFIGGSQPPKSMFSPVELPNYLRLVQTRDFKSDGFMTYIPRNSTTKFFGREDIMIGRYGPPIFQIFRGMEGAYNVALMKAKPKKDVDNDFLYYVLKQDSIFEYVDKLSARTGGQTGVDLVALNQYPIKLPDLISQRRIAAVLSALDDKIELNNRINAELEQMAKTLYDYWFVQFDFPNQDGKPYKSSGGEMVYDEVLKREIPEGWEVGTIHNVGHLLGGGTPRKDNSEFWNGTIPFFTPRDFENSFFTIETEGLITKMGLDNCSSRLYPKGTIFITARGTVGNINIASNEMAMNQSCYAVLPKPDINYYFLHQYCVDLIQYMKVKAAGSVFDALVSNDFKLTNAVVPTKNMIDLFGQKSQSFYEKILINRKQNQQLSSLRDWLLPMLMNGQITVQKTYSDMEADLSKFEMAAEPVAEYGRS